MERKKEENVWKGRRKKTPWVLGLAFLILPGVMFPKDNPPDIKPNSEICGYIGNPC
ncbi:MAG: hypothetical protein ABIL23_03765 [candidate division WOR-3 bacterium]